MKKVAFIFPGQGSQTIGMGKDFFENSELAKDRVAIRMLKGGHFVDNKTIDRRYPKSMKNLFKVLPLAKNVFIYDNSNNFKLIAQKKENQELEVLEHVAWFDNLLKELS